MIRTLLLIFLVLPLACRQNPNLPASDNTSQNTSAVSLSIKIPPSSGRMFVNTPYPLQVTLLQTDTKPDSLTGRLRQTKFTFAPSDSLSYQTNFVSDRTGKQTIQITAYRQGRAVSSASETIVLYSDITPKNQKVKILREYPHDPGAYTQGLEFYEGKLIESTGQFNRSTIRIVDLQTGKIEKTTSLPADMFGEGACTLEGEIYQLTWQNGVAFVYNPQDLTRIRQMGHNLREGWGLTSDGTQLIASDGSNKLHFVEPVAFGSIDAIEVYDHQQTYANLNELEYIDGLIYANVYGASYLLVIEPSTGRVLQKLDCSALVPRQFAGNTDKVLNGIARNTQTGNLLLTGKEWPKLYEVTVKD